MVFNPAAEVVVEAGDRLVVMAETLQLKQIEEKVSGKMRSFS